MVLVVLVIQLNSTIATDSQNTYLSDITIFNVTQCDYTLLEIGGTSGSAATIVLDFVNIYNIDNTISYILLFLVHLLL